MKQIEMFHGLTKVEQARLLGKLERLSFRNDETIFEQGESGDSMYVIESGKIELFTQGPDGKRFTLVTLGQGDAFGEMALLTGETRTATAMTVGETVLLRIDADTFVELINEKTAISAYFIKLLSKRLVQTNHSLHHSKEERNRLFANEFGTLPPAWQKALALISFVPFVRKQFVQQTLGLHSWTEDLQSFPKLSSYLKAMEPDDDLIAIHPTVLAALSETVGSRIEVSIKSKWTTDVADDFLVQGRPSQAATVLASAEEWDKLFGLLQNMQDWSKNERDIVARCPDTQLFRNFPVLMTFLVSCRHADPERGLAKLESALVQRTDFFTDKQSVELYKAGAEICHQLHHPKALEYLNLAMSLSGQNATEKNSDEQRAFFMTSLSLEGMRRSGLVEKASELFAKNKRSALLSVLLAIACLVFFHLAEPFAGLSREGMIFLGVAIAAVILWIVNIIPDFLVALLMAMYWVLSGLVKPEAALSGYASPVWLYMVFILALGAAITKSGILYRLSLYALKAFPSHYRGQLWGITASGLLLNPLIPSSSAKATLGVPIARTISESMGFADRSKGAAGLGLAGMIFYGFMAPFFLTGSYTNVMAYGLVSGKSDVSWFEWFWFALPGFFVLVCGMLIVIVVFFKPDTAARQVTKAVIDDQLQVLGPLTREEKVTIFVTVSCIILMMLQPLHGIENAWVMLLGFAFFVISGVLDSKTLKNGIDWTFLLFIGIAFSFAAVATQLGVADVMAGTLSRYMEPFMTNTYAFLLAVSVLSFFVTLVIRDDPAVILLVMSMLPLSQKMGIHPWVLVFVILLSTDPFFFPYQSPTYLTAYYSTEERSFDHRQGQFIAIFYALLVLLLIVVSVPFWRMNGLIQ